MDNIGTDDISYIDDLMDQSSFISQPGSQCKKIGVIPNPGVKRKLHDMKLEFFFEKTTPP